MNDKGPKGKKHLTLKKWGNLAIAAIITLYIATYTILIMSSNQNKMCYGLGGDFFAYWSAGKIMNEHSLTDVYDLELLRQTQKDIQLSASVTAADFNGVEVPYLPVFLSPFMLFAKISPVYSLLAWSVINFVAYTLYLLFFIKSYNQKTFPFPLVLFAIICHPFLYNMTLGQINVFLVICVGEFIRAFHANKPTQAGLWLGGLLLKPQLLILILPYLLIHRKFKTLTGFAVSSLSLLAVSFAMVGSEGFLDLKDILLESADGGAASLPQTMINWRMVGNNIGLFTSPVVGGTIILAGSAVTGAAALLIFSKKMPVDNTRETIALLGIFAATCLATWHSHLYMTIILIPPMLYLLVHKRMEQKLFTAWVFTPILFQVIVYISGALIVFNLLPSGFRELIDYTKGLPLFALNILIFAWAAAQFRQEETTLSNINENEAG